VSSADALVIFLGMIYAVFVSQLAETISPNKYSDFDENVYVRYDTTTKPAVFAKRHLVRSLADHCNGEWPVRSMGC
jgi:hypothetical protein